MRKLILIGTSLFLFGLMLSSCVKDVERPKEPLNLDPNHISVEQAISTMNVAIAELYGESATRAPRSYTIETLKGSDLQQSATRSDTLPPLPEDVLYIVNFANDEGYAILAADNRLDPVIAVTEQGRLSLDDFDFRDPTDTLSPLNPNEVIGDMVKRYTFKKFDPSVNVYLIGPDGDPIIPGQEPVPPVTPANFVEPLLTTRWNQNYPYNNLRPKNKDKGEYYGNRNAAGCAAIAFAQVMAYHEKPAVNSKQWTNSGPRVLGNNPNPDFVINSTWEKIKRYDYNIPSRTFDFYPKDDTDSLMYGYISRIIHSTAEFIGISDGGSLDPFDLWDINERFEDLGYKGSWFHWGLEDNIRDILNNLRLNRPVIVSAGDGFSGHTWIIDGFKYAPKIFVFVGAAGVGIEMRNCLMVHCNWGWGGDSDGYFLPYGLSSYNGYQEYDDPENAGMEFSYGWMFSTITIKP